MISKKFLAGEFVEKTVSKQMLFFFLQNDGIIRIVSILKFLHNFLRTERMFTFFYY